jgi:hypothetical protein
MQHTPNATERVPVNDRTPPAPRFWRLRIWHVALAVLWIAVLASSASANPDLREGIIVLGFWIGASAVSLACGLVAFRIVGRAILATLNRAWRDGGFVRKLVALVGALLLAAVMSGLLLASFNGLCAFAEWIDHGR